MSVIGDKVNVEFFGDHTCADVAESVCYVYRKPTRTANVDLTKAIAVSF